ncbi:protein N-terminal glutamine amidohydrolase-like [Chenopodium quinoa]|uniref:protein N-terminal glutamine amidohydrolase-like n=1 Tax=Chenopodium quinoa TaxID=63459 RepID=UPI000B775FAD|nr:protein N-terminal glutamine amidohydrolase-like [Chenopodium quinoa]
MASQQETVTPQFDHTPLYCEENVYRICKKLCSTGVADTEASDLFVVFISNDKKQIPLWHQKASHRADGVILWDYHVICIQKKETEKSPLVWDLDSTLPFPSPLASYVAETFRPSFPLFSEFRRFYRIVHAPMFFRCFASDRRHMKDSDGNWNSQPPPYDPIVAEDGTVHNLNEYVEIRSADAVPNIEADLVNAVKNERLGVVVNEKQIEEFFSLPT